MSDRFRPFPAEHLAEWVFDELDENDSILGVPRELFFTPSPADPFKTNVWGHDVDTPVGVAAGPHSQLAANIIVAWLSGARVIELKTVQTLDDLAVPKPCIDMQDEGYNVEWSQELTLRQSLDEYLLAWILIHALHRHLGFPGDRPRVVFNLSVGYDLDGVLAPNIQEFLDRVADPGARFNALLEAVAGVNPETRDVEIPRRFSDNVTVSTMHGCPPSEICGIARHLMERWGLHTSVKLNPTLLGPDAIASVLHDHLGYTELTVPDEAFEHDLSFEDALGLIDELREGATRCGVHFGVKLANTLEVLNHRQVFGDDQQRMYLSGRPLHALVVHLARNLTGFLSDGVAVSFAGGADAFNTPHLLAAGFRPVTSCSDLLRPPGYLRLGQYLEEISAAMARLNASDLDDLILRTAGVKPDDSIDSAAATNLARYAEQVLVNPDLKRDRFDRANTKTQRELGWFDCIKAPCADVCALGQRVPVYMRAVRDGDMAEAASITRLDNPLAGILGRACHHPCELPCVRTHLDDPLAIREIKRYITEHEPPDGLPAPSRSGDLKVAVIGGGPCGLSTATFLARRGVDVTVLEARSVTGGMVSGTIPGYRATDAAIRNDLVRVANLGLEVRTGQRIGRDLTLQALREEGFRYLVVAAGAQRGIQLGIPGESSPGAWDGLDFLRAARSRTIDALHGAAAVIGGGDAAMDCARTAHRLGARPVTVLYRRTMSEMPAQKEEIQGLLEEGIAIEELTVPVEVNIHGERVGSLTCRRTSLGQPDASGRRRPIEIPGSEYEVPLDTLIVAIGQRADLGLFGEEEVSTNEAGYLEVDSRTLETSISGVFAGGDIVGDGPATIVKAAGDGRRIAEEILKREDIETTERSLPPPRVRPARLLQHRARRQFRSAVPQLATSDRDSFAEVVQTMTAEQAMAEASRCLDCDLMCSTCEWVCPNRAIFTYRTTDIPREVPVLIVRGSAVGVESKEPLPIGQEIQVAVLVDLCNECGNCTTFCPTAGRPFRDKPRLFLHRETFEAAQDNAFMVTRGGDGWAVEGTVGGVSHRMEVTDRLRYITANLTVDLELGTFEMMNATVTRKTATTTVSLRECAMMWTLLKGLITSVPWIPFAREED